MSTHDRVAVGVLGAAAIGCQLMAAGPGLGAWTMLSLLLLVIGLGLRVAVPGARWRWASGAAVIGGIAVMGSGATLWPVLAGMLPLVALALPRIRSLPSLLAIVLVTGLTLVFVVALPRLLGPSADPVSPAVLLAISALALTLALVLQNAMQAPSEAST